MRSLMVVGSRTARAIMVSVGFERPLVGNTELPAIANSVNLTMLVDNTLLGFVLMRVYRCDGTNLTVIAKVSSSVSSI